MKDIRKILILLLDAETVAKLDDPQSNMVLNLARATARALTETFDLPYPPSIRTEPYGNTIDLSSLLGWPPKPK